MGYVRKADFYYGSMLSGLVNNGIAPAIIEPGETRRIYSLSTDRGDYLIYAKYVSSSSSSQSNCRLWHFGFSADEIRFIREYSEDRNSLYFALICGQPNFQDSEIAFLSKDEAKRCLDIYHERPSYRISIKAKTGLHGLRAYGTGLNDNNTIRIHRDYTELFLHKPQFI